MKKSIIRMLLLTVAFLILGLPVQAFAGTDMGTLSKDDPCTHIQFTLSGDSEFYGGFFSVNDTAKNNYIAIDKLTKGDAPIQVDFANISSDFDIIASYTFTKGESSISEKLPDFKAGEMYFIQIEKPDLAGLSSVDIGISIYSKDLGGTKYDFSGEKQVEQKTPSGPKISISEESLVFTKKGEKAKLKVTLDKSLKKNGVTWSSSNKKVAVVNKKGKVVAKGYGSAVITCTSKKNKSYSVTCSVTVEKAGKDSASDEALLAKMEKILKGTGEPIYQYLNGMSSTTKIDAAGNMIWSVSYQNNGTLNTVTAYDNSDSTSYNTAFIRQYPCVTGEGSVYSSIRDDLKNGTYDYKNDNAGVVIGWSMFDTSTSKEDLENMIGSKLTDELYETLNKKYTSYSNVIIYGKNADGVLTARYAGFVNYSGSSSYASYSIYGVAEDNQTRYGKLYSGNVSY